MAFPVRDEPLPVELVNTLYAERGRVIDGLASPDDLPAWLQAHRERFETGAGVVSGERLKEFRELREALRALFRAVLEGEPPPAAAIETLNRMSGQVCTFLQLEWPEGRQPVARMESLGQDPGTSALAEVARAGIALLGSPHRERLRACGAPGCVLFFLKDHPRREWCSGACGNRARAARHYRRHRG